MKFVLLSAAAAVSLLLSACGSCLPTSSSPPAGGPVLPSPVLLGQAVIEVHAFGGVHPEITLAGPQQQTQTLERGGDHLLSALPAGVYTMTAPSVASDGFIYVPEFVGNPVLILPDQVAHAEVNYVPTTGHLALTVLTSTGIRPSVEVSGPDGFSRKLTAPGTVILKGLTPGIYTVKADTAFNLSPVLPAVFGSTLEVVAGTTQAASVSYGRATGKLDIQVLGVPDGAANVKVTAGNEGSLVLQGSRLLSGWAAGPVHLEAQEVSVNGRTYAPEVEVLTTQLQPNEKVELRVVYHLVASSVPPTENGQERQELK